MKPSYRRIITVPLFCIAFIADYGSAQSVVINEFMASNTSAIADPDYNGFADWIELYNQTDMAINLRGYSMTDLLTQPKKYIFSADIIIQPKSFLIVWADNNATGVHTNFKLSASGEQIGLFDSSGDAIDTLTFGEQKDDISYGRFPDGGTTWYSFSPSSPGAANLESSISNKLDSPQISLTSGFYPNATAVIITKSDSGAVIHYTIDGSEPTVSSLTCDSSLAIDSTTVLRVKVFKSGYIPSPIVTRTYFIAENIDLPVFSLITDPANFFSDTAGIYVAGTNGIIGNCSTLPRNWNQDWERPVELQFFEKNKSMAFDVSAGVQIFGGCARLYAEKSLAFYFRKEYGFDKLHYRLFPDQYIDEYNNFVLRSSGQDWWRTMFRDGMVQTLFRQGMKLDCQDYRPSVLFINGAYWGIHNIREKLNEHYPSEHYGVDGDSIDLVEISKEVVANNGDTNAYNSLIDFLSTKNMQLTANYDSVKSLIDIDEYIDYVIAEIYAANGDWPGANMKLWRVRAPGTKWRWMVYDLDFTFGGNAEGQSYTNTLAQATAANGPSWPNPPWATVMLRKLLDNTTFKNEFIQRFAAHMNTTFSPYHVLHVIDSLKQGIASEIDRHVARWPQSLSIGTGTWDGNIQIMRDFAVARPGQMRGFFYSKFNISGSNTLTIGRNDPSMGKVYTQSVEVAANDSVNTFFRNIPLRVKAVALPGYRFSHWQGVISTTAEETTFAVTTNGSLTAVFEPAVLSDGSPVINEINYKSSSLFDTDDWVELFNPSTDSVDMTGWKFQNDTTKVFIFPDHYIVPGKGYLVLCKDTSKFLSRRQDVTRLLGNFNFGLSSSGDRVQLLDNNGSVVDDVAYGTSGDWTSGPNGSGVTLSLTNPVIDNASPASWKPSLVLYGTPGRLNDVYTKVPGEGNDIPSTYMLFNNYPNPFNPSTTISFYLPEKSPVQLTVYNQLGQEVQRLVSAVMEKGYHSVVFSAPQFSSGLYFCEMTTPAFHSTKKLVLVK